MKLPPELLQVHAMLCGFLLADEEHWDIPPVALLQQGIVIHIDLAEDRAEFAQERRDGGLSFVAEVTPGSGVERDVERTASGQPRILGRAAHGRGFEYFMNGPE